MSESTNTEKKEFKSPSWVRSLIWVLIGVIIGIVVGYGIFSATLSQSVSTTTGEIIANYLTSL